MPENININEHEGSKYLRKIKDARGELCNCPQGEVMTDVYAILVAYNVTCPGRQQAIKKLLCSGLRGKGSQMDDLIGAQAALNRAIDLQRDADFKAS